MIWFALAFDGRSGPAPASWYDWSSRRPAIFRLRRGEQATADAVHPTLDAVCGWYHIHPKFAGAILQKFAGDDYDRNIGDIHKLLDRYDSLRIQLEYAFSTNVRGQTLVRQLGEWGVAIDGGGTKSYLDIGCAYGGFLIAFANRGYEVTGIELDEQFGRLGKLNLAAAGYADRISMGDFLSEDAIAANRQFDLITCNDVIEHVSDPETCLRKICGMLKPGGAAYVASPNKLSIPNVRSDVHFQRFGLTLLDYFRARAAYTMYSDYPHYTVSDFYEPEWYLNTVTSAGATAEIVYDSAGPQFDAPAEIALLYSSFAEWAKSGSKKLDPLMRHEIMQEFADYSTRMFRAYGESVQHNAFGEFSRNWIDPLTRILIRKPSA